MSFETTLVCDGCSCVIDGGNELRMQTELIAEGGRCLMRDTGGWRDSGQPSAIPSSRHLCGRCAPSATELFNGERVFEKAALPAGEKT